MFGRKKIDASSYSADDVKNMLGYALQNREDILSRADVSPLEEPLTGVLGFMPGVDHELDALVLYYVFKAYEDCGIDADITEKAFSKLFQEFVQDKALEGEKAKKIHKQLIAGVHNYQRRNTSGEVAAHFLSKLTGKFEREERSTVALVGSNFRQLEKTIHNNIQRDIQAS